MLAEVVHRGREFEGGPATGVVARLDVELQDTLQLAVVAVAVYLGVDNLVVVVVEAALAADTVLVALYETLPWSHSAAGVRVGAVVSQGPAAAPRARILSRHETLLLLAPYYFLPKFDLIMGGKSTQYVKLL